MKTKKLSKPLETIILLVVGLMIGIFLKSVLQTASSHQLARYEIVVAPTKSSTITYAPNDHESFSYDNPRKKLCGVVYDRKKGFYQLYEIKPAY